MIIKQRSSCGFVGIILLLCSSSFKFSSTSKTSASQPNTVLYSDHGNKRAVYLTANGTDPCRVYGQSESIQFLRKVATVVRQVGDSALQMLIEDCHGHLLSRAKRESAGNRLDFIYPGTKWCGPGNVATNYDDLGLYADTDQCCREHDLCPDFISSGECKHGLCNTSPFTRSHCNCDENFRQCLSAIDNTVSNAVGVAFFNVGNIVCFRNDYPIIGCLNFAGIFGTCSEYKLNVTQPTKWQFFHNVYSRKLSLLRTVPEVAGKLSGGSSRNDLSG